MKKNLLLLCIFPALAFANEQYSQPWHFATPDQVTVGLNKLQLFCTANKSECPAGLSSGIGRSGANGSGLFTPTTSSSANQISVIVAGDDNSVELVTDQDSEGNTIEAEQENNATIDYDEVLNVTNE